MGNDELDPSLLRRFAWHTANEVLPSNERPPVDVRSTEALHGDLRGRRFDLRASAMGDLRRLGALTHDDLEFVIRDMTLRGLPRFGPSYHDLEIAYLCECVPWLQENRPSDLVALLKELYNVAASNGSRDKEAAWAIKALTIIEVDQGLPFIDSWLASAHSSRRDLVMFAVRFLPLELAEPRIRRAARDPVWGVRMTASWCWECMTEGTLELDELTGVNLKLLRGAPPSAAFLERLRLVRRGHDRTALAAQLFNEAPDPEALCLLVVAVQDDEFILEAWRANLLDSRGDWASRFVSRFGEDGVEALCALARTASPDDLVHWVDYVSGACDLARGCVPFRKRRQGPAIWHVRELARDLLHANPTPSSVPRGLIACMNQLPEAETQEWVWKLPSSGSLRSGWKEIGDLLLNMKRDDALDATIADQFEAALEARNFNFARAIVFPGAVRRIERVILAARRELDNETTVETAALHEACVTSLRYHNRLDAAWLERAVIDPRSPAIRVAESAFGCLSDISRQTLERHLKSPDLECAVRAAKLYLRLGGYLARWNCRIGDLHELAPPELSLELTHPLLEADKPVDPLLRHIEPLFACDDDAVAKKIESVAIFLLQHRPTGDKWLRLIAERTPLQRLASTIDWQLKLHLPHVEYWLEAGAKSN